MRIAFRVGVSPDILQPLNEVISRRHLGRQYEQRTVAWFESQPDYQVIATNYTIRGGELDLVVLHSPNGTPLRSRAARGSSHELVFVEVRYRDADSRIEALESVTVPKRRRILRAAKYFLAHERIRAESVRFDLIAWKGDTFAHIKDAWRY